MRVLAILSLALACGAPTPARADEGRLEARPRDSAPPPDREHGARLRFGLSGGPYPLAYSHDALDEHDAAWLGLQLHARIGVQLDDLVALYHQAGGLIGAQPGGLFVPYGGSTVGLFVISNAVFAEVTLADRAQIALGAGVWTAKSDRTRGWLVGPGLSHRVGLVGGGGGAGTRQGFTGALQLDLVWLPDSQPDGIDGYLLALSVQLGWET